MAFLHQHAQMFSNKILPKKKIFTFETKIALIGYFGLEFQKTNVEFEISILEFHPKTTKKFNLGPKIPYLGIFGLRFNKNYYRFFNQHTRICETIKFHLKRKKITLGPKMLYLGLYLKC